MSLIILLDENVSPEIAAFIRELRPDWEVRHVYDLGLAGASDTSVFQRAQDLAAVVITFDEDFADARMYPAGTHCGVVRLKVWPTTLEETQRAIRRVLETMPDDAISGALIIIDNSRIRVRRAARHDGEI